MIDQDKLLDLYCDVKTKEELLHDIDIENQNPRIKFEFFAYLVQNLSPAQKQLLMEMTDKETIVKFVKMTKTTEHPKPMDLPIVADSQGEEMSLKSENIEPERKPFNAKRIPVDRNELSSVMPGVGLPEWYRDAVREITGNRGVSPIWRGRYKLMFKSLSRRYKPPFVYDYCYDHYLKAVEARKNDQQGSV